MIPAASGFLLFLAFLPLPTPHLAWIALAPWLWELDRDVAGGCDLRAAAWSGVRLFAVFWGLNLAWVLLLVPRLGVIWPVWAYAGQLLFLALLGAATGTGIHALRIRASLPLPLAAAVGWVGVEWIRGNLLGPFRFPWSPVALPLADLPAFVQPAAWVGESGLGAGVVAVNAVVAMGWRSRGESTSARWLPRRPGMLVAAVLALAAWSGSGRARMASLSPEPVVTAAAVQPALPLTVKRDPARALEAARESSTQLLALLRGSGAQVVVLPETHYPVVLDDGSGAKSDPEGAAVALELAGWASELGAPVLVGAYGAAPGGRTNAVARVTPAGVAEVYGKVGLVPGVERTARGGLVEGMEAPPLQAPGRPVPLVCIESAWSGLATRGARHGGGWLLNVTNDGWLGEAPRWTRTPAFHQHPRHLVLRSVETGLGALRVGNNGLTGVVSPTGEWMQLLPPHREGVAVATVTSLPGGTPYRAAGDVAGPLAALALCVGLAGTVLRQVRSPVDPANPRL